MPCNDRIVINTQSGQGGPLYFVDAPFSLEQVESLNAYQSSGVMHPFTCAGDRADAAHHAYQAKHGGDRGQLMAIEAGWICPVCGSTQDWAWLWMSDWSWRPSDLASKGGPA